MTHTPAEALMGQKLCTTLDALWTEQHQQWHHTNKKQGNTFLVGTPVFARNYRFAQQYLTPGTIHKRKGQYIYDVQVGNQLWAWHKNQIPPTYTKKLHS